MGLLAGRRETFFEERRQEVLYVLLDEIGFPQWWIDEADGLFALSQQRYMQVTDNAFILPHLRGHLSCVPARPFAFTSVGPAPGAGSEPGVQRVITRIHSFVVGDLY